MGCFWPYDPQSFVQQKICHGVSIKTNNINITKAERALLFDSWLAEWHVLQWQMTVHLSILYTLLRLLCSVNMLKTTAAQNQMDKQVQILTYIWINVTSEWLWKHLCSTCTSKFCAKAATDIWASESKFRVQYHDGVVCPSCMHTANNSMYFVRAAVVHTSTK